MFKRYSSGILFGILLLAGLWPAVGHAQLLGGLATAAVEEVGARKVGGYVGITDNFVSITGSFRYGVASSFDLGVKAAFVDFESPLGSSVGLNADGRVQILDVFLQDPFDLAFGPEVTYFSINDVTSWYFGGYVVASKEFVLTNGKQLTPYGRVGLRLHRTEFESTSDSEMDAGFSVGVEYVVAGYTSLWSELMLEDAGTGIFLGFQYQLR